MRFAGAAFRAFLVMMLVATPSMMLAGVSADAKQMVALISLFLASLIFVEYFALNPSLIEFREAAPFNRLRFLMLFLTVFLMSVMLRGQTDPTNMTMLVTLVGGLIGEAIDFPYSPVRLVLQSVSQGTSEQDIALLRAAAGITYLTSLICLAFFVIMIRAGLWPATHRAFNVWVNLPTFDPTRGGDVVARLTRDARVNIVLGFLLPFLIPVVLGAAADNVVRFSMETPQMMIWVMAAWAFLPASLFMRGLAMGQIADMIQKQRARDSSDAQRDLAVIA